MSHTTNDLMQFMSVLWTKFWETLY